MMELVTGTAGTNHVSGADMGAYNAGIVGEGAYILPTGNRMKVEKVNDNTVRIRDGVLVYKGRQIIIESNDYEEVTINNGASGTKRHDLIVARIEKNADTEIESATLAVITGEFSDTPADPEHTNGTILNGDYTIDECPICRVVKNGLEIETIEMLVGVITNISDLEKEVDKKTNEADFNSYKAYNEIELSKKATQVEVDELKEQMEEFSKLPEGSTAANEELLDIRKGADGKSYSTAGEAVRQQHNIAMEKVENASAVQSVSGTNPTASNSTAGKVIYLENSGYTSQDGEPTPSNPIRIGGLADKGYFDGVLDIKSVGSLADAISNKNPFTCKAGDVIKVFYEDVVDNFSMQIIDTDGQAWSYNLSNVNVMEWSAPKDAQEVYFYIKDDTISSVADAKHISVTINGMYALRVKTCGKNLLKNTATTTTTSGVTFTVNDDGSVNVSGTCTNYTSIKIGEFKPKIGEKYTFTSESEAVVNKYNCNANNINGVDSWKYDGHSFEATTEDTVSVHVVVYAGATLTNYTVKPMIRLASDTDATYEPYQETEALIHVSAPLYEGDYIEVYADGSGCEYRKMGVADLTDARWYKNTAGQYYTDLNAQKFRSGCNGKCTHLKVDTNMYSGADGVIFVNPSQFIRVNITTTEDTVDSVKSALSGAIFVGELATPTSTPLTAEQVAEFMKLQTFKGVTHVTADGEVVMRYYCDNASGDTVSMLQGMVGARDVSQKLSHIGMIIHSTTLDTMEKVVSIYGGNTWEKIEGRFLLGQSSEYKIDTTGGEAEHYLTEDEMPEHTHLMEHTHSVSMPTLGQTTINIGSGQAAATVSTPTGLYGQSTTSEGNESATTSAGLGSAHNNMPPYKVVYIWERTA